MRKFTALLLAMITVLSLSATAMILPTYAGEVIYRDVSAKHWAYESISAVTEAGLMHGRGTPNGVQFQANMNITGTEILATLYRLAGSPEVVPTFVDELQIRYFDKIVTKKKWYTDSWLWAMYNGIYNVEWNANNVPEFYTPEVRWGRYGSEIRPAEHWSIDYQSGKMFGDESDVSNCASRADVILALYFYVTTYLEIEVTETSDLNMFSDWREDRLKPSNFYGAWGSIVGKFGRIFERVEPEELVAACEWAVGAGIIEGYPDGTLGLQHDSSYIQEDVLIESFSPRVVTRAEYAVILDRFMQYLEEIK